MTVVVSKRNDKVNRADGSGKTDVEAPIWDDCVDAANDSKKMDVPNDVKNFYMYQDGKDPSSPNYKDSSHNYKVYKTYGPFKKKGKGGSVSEGDNAYIVFYNRLPKPPKLTPPKK